MADMKDDDRRDLDALAAEVRGLRSDLRGYREAIGDVLAQRTRAIVGSALVVVFVAVASGIGGMWIVSQEADRAERTRDRADATACLYSRNLQTQLATAIAGLENEPEDVLARALEVLARDPCALPDGEPPGRG